MKKILVSGAEGQLGREIQEAASLLPDHEWVFCGRADFDLTSPSHLEAVFERFKPDFLINCAAYTAVDKAESEREKSFLINEDAVAFLAGLCRKSGAALIHISTDFVFAGDACTPYTEESVLRPLGVYAASKAAGEKAILDSGCAGAIVRTSWVFSPYGNNFVKTMLRLTKERETLGVVFDQTGSPTYARDLAFVLLELISQEKCQEPVKVYHFSNEGVASWYDLAWETARLAGNACAIRPILSAEYPTPAKRPHYSVLDKAKIKKELGISIRHWREALQDCLERMQP